VRQNRRGGMLFLHQATKDLQRMANSTILSVSEIGRWYGAAEIFRGISFQLADREHVALVGANGAGKSTLLKIVAGAEEPSEGSLAIAIGSRVTYLPQEARFSSDRTVREEARLAFAETLAAEARMREIEAHLAEASDLEMETLLAEYDRLHSDVESQGGYDVEHRTDEVLMGLGFTLDQFNEPVNQLSGGQKTRVALAKALLSGPDLLLLDEPTNHLDLAMLEWLEGFLLGFSQACLVVSHDRYFLDRVTTRTLDLSHGILEDYPAPYSRYMTLREERHARRRQEYEEQQAFIARTEDFIRKYKAGQRSREARGRQTRLDRLERIEPPRQHVGVKLQTGAVVRSGSDVLSTGPLSVGYRDERGAHELVRTPSLKIERGERVALIGPNGSGKTSLLRALTREIEPLKGRFSLGANVQLGYYAQAHEGLPAEGTPLSIVLSAQPMGEEAARNYLGRFVFSDDDVFKPISALSGGERSRLAIALLLLRRANFLVLDEPTNHLDVRTRETLETMLREFDGTILFVSHDRFFVDRLATMVWAIEDGEIKPYFGNYTDYQRALGRRGDALVAANGKSARAADEISSKPAPESRLLTALQAPANGQTQKSLTQIEREISKLEGKLNELSDALTVASIDEDLDAVTRLGAEYDRTQTDLDAAYAQWEEFSSQYEIAAGPRVRDLA